VRRSGGVVAQGLGGEAADEDGAGGGDLFDQIVGVLGLKREVFGAVEVGDLAGGVHVAHLDDPGLGQGGAGDVGAGQGFQLRLDLFEDGVDGRGRVADEDDLGVCIVLGLAEQVGGGDLRIGRPSAMTSSSEGPAGMSCDGPPGRAEA
jgi:hypothetical protein